MALQKLTIEFPETIYRRIASLAKSSKRPLAEQTISLVQSALSRQQQSSSALEEKLEQLSFFTDAELLNAAQSTAATEEEDLMQGLLEKQQREGLTSNEIEQVQSLSEHFNQIMFVRAKSTALLVEHGYDISTILV